MAVVVAVTAEVVVIAVEACHTVAGFRTVVRSVADFTAEAAMLRRCARLHHRADIMLPRRRVQVLRAIPLHRHVRLRRLTRLHQHT